MTIATLSVNIAANLVGPSYDLTNLAPRLFTFRRAALVACGVGVVILPWKLISNPHVYIFTWLGVVGGVLAPVAAILIADYWVVRRTELNLLDLYGQRGHDGRSGRYWYTNGWNLKAVGAFALAALLSVGGSYSAPGGGPFPRDGIIPFLRPLADYGWIVGFTAGFAIYLALTRLFPTPVVPRD